jgi:hypothetical protein
MTLLLGLKLVVGIVQYNRGVQTGNIDELLRGARFSVTGAHSTPAKPKIKLLNDARRADMIKESSIFQFPITEII